MLSISQLKKQMDSTDTIRLITQSLGDIATIKIKSTRASVERNIAFFKEITQVYRLVKLMAIKKRVLKERPKQKPGQTICVLLTSNEHFYGDLDVRLTEFYKKNTQNLKADKLVIGSVGQKLYSSAMGTDAGFKSLTLDKDIPSNNELQTLADIVFEYSKALVYHTKFVTILNSEPTVSDITASDISGTASISTLPVFYIVEPEIDKIMSFFESQLLLVLFQAIFLEIDITRQAARMISMIQANDNATEIAKQQHKSLIAARKQLLNFQIQETFAALMSQKLQD